MNHQEDIWLSPRMNTDIDLMGGFDPQGVGDADDHPVGWIRAILDADTDWTDDPLFAACNKVDPNTLDQEATGLGN